MRTYQNIGVIILAAGKGSRLQTTDRNKVTLHIRNKPIIRQIVQLFEQLHIGSIIVVVGHAKTSVIEALENIEVTFAEQDEQLGTGHAVSIGLKKVPDAISELFIIYGDDVTFYPVEMLQNMIEQHEQSNAAVTLVTFTLDNPTGLGRIIRDKKGKIKEIVEEKNATEEQKQVKEINAGLYLFQKDFLLEYLPKVGKNTITGEYYLTDCIALALLTGHIVETVEAGNTSWRGIVNTPDDFKSAKKLAMGEI